MVVAHKLLLFKDNNRFRFWIENITLQTLDFFNQIILYTSPFEKYLIDLITVANILFLKYFFFDLSISLIKKI